MTPIPLPSHAPRTAHRPSARTLAQVTLWGVLPVALTAFAALRSRGAQVHFAGDFHYAFWPAAHRVLHGLSPYVDPTSPTVGHAIAFVYPAVAALLLAPFALIGHAPADVVFAGLQIAAALLTLRVLDVRDRRLYGLVMLCPAVFSGWSVANVSLLLGLGVAAAWRTRSRPLICGLAIALLVSVKLFLWPLGLWLLATRRYAALAWAATWAVALNALAWAVLGLGEVHRYSALLRAVTAHEERLGYSAVALASHFLTGRQAAYALALALAAAVAVGCVALGRKGRDLAALSLAIGASLLATPIVQLHYFALLIVPLAIARPRLAWTWALPLAMWVCAAEAPRAWQAALALALGGAMIAVALRTAPPRQSRPRGTRDPRDRTSRLGLDLRLVPPSASSVAAGELGR